MDCPSIVGGVKSSSSMVVYERHRSRGRTLGPDPQNKKRRGRVPQGGKLQVASKSVENGKTGGSRNLPNGGGKIKGVTPKGAKDRVQTYLKEMGGKGGKRRDWSEAMSVERRK